MTENEYDKLIPFNCKFPHITRIKNGDICLGIIYGYVLKNTQYCKTCEYFPKAKRLEKWVEMKNHEITIDQKIKAVEWYQTSHYNQLICNRCDGFNILVPIIENEKVILRCPHCFHHINKIPEIIFKLYGWHDN